MEWGQIAAAVFGPSGLVAVLYAVYRHRTVRRADDRIDVGLYATYVGEDAERDRRAASEEASKVDKLRKSRWAWILYATHMAHQVRLLGGEPDPPPEDPRTDI